MGCAATKDIAGQFFARSASAAVGRISQMAICAALAFLFIGGCNGGCNNTTAPTPPNGVRCFKKTIRAQVRPTNLPEWKDPGYQIVRFVKPRGSELIAAVLQVAEPRFSGPMGGVRQERVWQRVLMALGSGEAHIDLPVEDDIEHYLILVRPIGLPAEIKNDAWRIWKVDPTDVANGDNSLLILPSFGELQSLNQRNDEKDILNKYLAAEAFQLELKN